MWYKDPKQNLAQMLLPQALMTEVLQLHHDHKLPGHPGQERMYNRIRQKFFWYGMKKDVADYVHSCDACQRNKPALKNPKHAMQEVGTGFAMERVHADILRPLPVTRQMNRYALVVDAWTKWVEAIPLQE